MAYKLVTNAHMNQFDSVGLVSLRDEKDGSETHLSVTTSHPFYHSETGWVHASLLKVGDTLTEDEGGTLTVTEVVFDKSAPINITYNLEVADFHTYFVGTDGVLVHNGFNWREVALIPVFVGRFFWGDLIPGPDSSDGSNPKNPTQTPASASCPIPKDRRRWRIVEAFGEIWRRFD